MNILAKQKASFGSLRELFLFRVTTQKTYQN